MSMIQRAEGDRSRPLSPLQKIIRDHSLSHLQTEQPPGGLINPVIE